MKNTMKKFLCMMLVAILCVTCVPVSRVSAVGYRQIPEDAVEYNGHYYKIYEVNITPNEAKEYCENLGGHLATITSKEENDVIIKLTDKDKYKHHTGAVIGLFEQSNGKWTWVTEEALSYSNWATKQPDNVNNDEIAVFYLNDGDYGFKKGQWDDGAHYNDPYPYFICEWEPNIYNLGEETYSFVNYDNDNDSPGGHCFGMSITSAGYYLGYLNPTDVGVNSSSEIYTIEDNPTVREPICYYQGIQGSLRNLAIVAGNTEENIFNKYYVESDWNQIIDYIKDHSYDDKGLLQILYFLDGGAHAINFLRYDNINDQIYVYDNNDPQNEQTLKMNANGTVTTPFGLATSIALVYVPAYFNLLSAKEVVDEILRRSIYFLKNNVSIISEGTAYVMATDNTDGEYYVYEIAEGQTNVKIVPLVDNATFKYMGQEYTFGEIDDDTYAELNLSLSEDDTPTFTIINSPEDEPIEPDEPTADEPSTEPESPDDTTDSCSHLCHKTGFIGFIWTIINFFCRIFKVNKVCSCGKAHW